MRVVYGAVGVSVIFVTGFAAGMIAGLAIGMTNFENSEVKQ